MTSTSCLFRHSVTSVIRSLRSAITASSMNIPKPVIDDLDSFNLEKLSLAEPMIKPRRDYRNRRPKKNRQEAQFLEGASQGVSHRSFNPLGALDPVGLPKSASHNSASVSKNRHLPRPRVNQITRYSTAQNSSRLTRVEPDFSKFAQPADAPTLSSHNTLPPKQSSTTTSEMEKQTSYIEPAKEPRYRDRILHLPAPPPTSSYLSLALDPTKVSPTPQRLLLVLDLNGTLILRSHGATRYKSRPHLSQFLDYCFANHTVLVWSSAKPHNVDGICLQLFSRKQLEMLLGVWARDTLSLTPEQYNSRVQVYKRLDRIWDDPTFARKHPEAHLGARWSQANTLLIDDSVIKASAQPYNLVETPEFTEKSKEEKRKEPNDVLGQVVAYLEEARTWDNVSSFVRERKFVVDTDWWWNWKSKKRVFQTTTTSDDEEGGVRLDT